MRGYGKSLPLLKDKFLSLGIYISVPFCRSKCSYCNFASDVLARSLVEAYVDRVCADIRRAAWRRRVQLFGSSPQPTAGHRVLVDFEQRGSLIGLATQSDLFPAEHFKVFGSKGTIYHLAEDPDGRFALYGSAGVPGKYQPPHNHTTWATIAGGDRKSVV